MGPMLQHVDLVWFQIAGTAVDLMLQMVRFQIAGIVGALIFQFVRSQIAGTDEIPLFRFVRSQIAGIGEARACRMYGVISWLPTYSVPKQGHFGQLLSFLWDSDEEVGPPRLLVGVEFLFHWFDPARLLVGV